VLAALEPASVALKFGFVAVLFLFLLWVARSSMKDLRRVPGQGPRSQWVDDAPASEETGLHSAVSPKLGSEPRLIVERAPSSAAASRPRSAWRIRSRPRATPRSAARAG
jgi:hypothetical protein